MLRSTEIMTTTTRIDEIAPDIYRINTPVTLPGDGGSFNFNQYLLVDEEPLLFHTGLRQLFPAVSAAIARVMPLDRLRYVSFAHVEADECGALNHFLAVAPRAVPLCSRVAAMVSVGDLADRPPRPIADGERLSLGSHEILWLDTPHLPHGWESGLVMDVRTRTLFCGDLFTQGGSGDRPITDEDILEASEAFRALMDYYSHAPDTARQLDRLAGLEPATLACMHGSAWQGDGAAMLKALAERVG
jgi:flavorubredoxin